MYIYLFCFFFQTLSGDEAETGKLNYECFVAATVAYGRALIEAHVLVCGSHKPYSAILAFTKQVVGTLEGPRPPLRNSHP